MNGRLAVVDKDGWVMAWCDELQGLDQIEAMLRANPDWSVRFIERR